MSRNRKRSGKPTNGKPESKRDAQTSGTSSREDQISTDKPDTTTSGASTVVSKSNDPAWYAPDEALLRDSSSIPFSLPFGEPIRFRDTTTSTVIDLSDLDTQGLAGVPGVIALQVKPTIGRARSRLDPVNAAANAFYTHVRYVNSGRKNYDPADLMMYALAIGELYSFIQFAKRTYAFAFMYSQRNKFFGRAMIEASGLDPDDLIANLAQFRYWLNAFINKVSSYVIPSDINYFKRKFFLYSGYYLENPYGNLKDQFYMYIPGAFGKFNYDATNAGMIEMVDYDPATLKTVAQFITYGEGLLDNIFGDEDFGLMSGDILKAYPNSLIGLETLPSDYMVLPEFDPFVLSQFKNAVVAPSGQGLKYYLKQSTKEFIAGNIYQDEKGQIVSEELLGLYNDGSHDLDDMMYAFAPMNKHIISVENPDPGPNDVMEATRACLGATTTMDAYSDAAYTTLVVNPEITCGDVYVNHIDIFYWERNANGDYVKVRHDQNCAVMDMTSPLPAWYQIYAQCKYAPNMYSAFFNTGTKKAMIGRVVTNVDNYTTIGYDELRRMHETAMLGLFYVPGVAKLLG